MTKETNKVYRDSHFQNACWKETGVEQLGEGQLGQCAVKDREQVVCLSVLLGMCEN